MIMVSEGEVINFQNAPLQFFQLSIMPVAEKVTLKKKLKTELAHVQSAFENIVADCERRLAQKHSVVLGDKVEVLGKGCAGGSVPFSNHEQQPSLTDENYQGRMVKKSFSPGNKRPADNHVTDEIIMVPEKSEARSVVTGAYKGSTLQICDEQNGNDHRMDSSKTRQCANTLKTLMNHPTGWVFNQPVDPIKLNIPDYFSIISKPMDLGTIKHKLGNKQYSSTLHFAEDVRLTFSNAMQYNPPGNEVHIMAKELNNIFISKWKLLEAKWRKENPVSSPQSVSNTQKKIQVPQKRASTNPLSQKSITSAEKLRLKEELSNLSARKMPPRLISFLQSKCVLGQIGDFANVDLDMFDEETIWELHQMSRSCFGAVSTEIKTCARQPEHDCCKGTSETVLQSGVMDESISPSACMKNAHGTVECRCSRCNDNSHASSGVGSRSNDSIQSIPCLSSPSTTEESGLPSEEQLSPVKALRAAMLKSRFAHTILKAQQQSLGEKVDPAKLQREREKLEKKQQEEKARIEAQVRATQVAARMKAEAELKQQREREREAARLALQKMEKTVDIDNSHILKDLENFGCPLPQDTETHSQSVVGSFVHEFQVQFGFTNPLEKLGLFMKEDLEEVDDWISAAGNGGVEEGEINYA